MPRLKSVISRVIAVIIGLPVLAIIVFVAYGFMSNQLLHNSLENEYSQLQTPPGCVKNYSYYQKGGLFFGSDAASHLQVEYKCQVTGGQAYDSIIADLKNRGYKVISDNSIPTNGDTGLAYSFIYSSKHFTANYDFHPNQPSNPPTLPDGATNLTVSELRPIQVTGISLRLE